MVPILKQTLERREKESNGNDEASQPSPMLWIIGVMFISYALGLLYNVVCKLTGRRMCFIRNREADNLSEISVIKVENGLDANTRTKSISSEENEFDSKSRNKSISSGENGLISNSCKRSVSDIENGFDSNPRKRSVSGEENGLLTPITLHQFRFTVLEEYTFY